MSDAALLPPSASTLERAVAEACAVIENIPAPLRESWSPSGCPTHLLPWLAWAFGVEEWSEAWTEDQKRSAIAMSLPVKRTKGTIGAVNDVIVALGLTARVQEWFNQVPAGAAYTYRLHLDVDQIGYDLDQLRRLLLVVSRAKNLRSHLDTILPSVTTRSGLVSAAATNTGHEIRVGYGAPTYSDNWPAVDLIMDAAVNGEASSVAAIDSLHVLLHDTMPQPAYW